MRNIATLHGMLPKPFFIPIRPYRIPARFSASSHVSSTLLYLARQIPDFARNITSRFGNGPPSSWQRALIRRFALLRHTALPDFFPAIKATRPLGSCCFSLRNTMSVRYGVCERLPCANKTEISALDAMVSNTSLDYTQRRLRPLARRAESTARPPFVAIRARKP